MTCSYELGTFLGGSARFGRWHVENVLVSGNVAEGSGAPTFNCRASSFLLIYEYITKATIFIDSHAATALKGDDPAVTTRYSVLHQNFLLSFRPS